jgi:hypothetical protein
LVWLTGRLMADYKAIADFPQRQWRGYPQGLL